jgi:hypothetical protein
MRDVAARAGVSLKTVSRVVNGAAGVSPSLEEAVRRSIAELDYRPDDTARGLRRGRTLAVGPLVDGLADPFFSTVARAVEEVLRGHGLLLFTAAAGDGGQERNAALAFALLQRRAHRAAEQRLASSWPPRCRRVSPSWRRTRRQWDARRRGFCSTECRVGRAPHNASSSARG